MKKDEISFNELISRLKRSTQLAINYVTNISPEAFSKDTMRCDAVSKRLENIGETANDLKKLFPEVLEKHSNIPWNRTIGLRNRVVHDYHNIDNNMIYAIAKNDLPDLLKTLDKMEFERFQISPSNTTGVMERLGGAICSAEQNRGQSFEVGEYKGMVLSVIVPKDADSSFDIKLSGSSGETTIKDFRYENGRVSLKGMMEKIDRAIDRPEARQAADPPKPSEVKKNEIAAPKPQKLKFKP